VAPFGLGPRPRASDAVPVDLPAPIPSPLTRESYQALSLAARNTAIVGIIARQSGVTVDRVAEALPNMMGRQAIDSQAGIRNALSIGESARRGSRPGDDDVLAVLQGEMDLAVRCCVPRDDRNRAAIERNLAKFGARLDERFILQMLLSTRYPRMGLDLTGIFNGAAQGEIDLAFAVGTIRKAAENSAAEMAKIR
jgi:hypothetical protein